MIRSSPLSDEKPKKFDVDATIQLDKLDAEQFTVPDSVSDLSAAKRVTPPPLPPEELLRASKAPVAPVTTSQPPVRPSSAPPRSMGKTIGLVALFVVLIGLAIFGGLHVGGLAHTAPSAPASLAAAPTPTPAPSPAPSATTSASGHVEITIPTIEMR